MCGICGIVNFNGEPVQEDKIRMMMRIMKHRGPDDEGIFIDNNIGLGFVRLSILDLSKAGHQPMFSNDNRYVIIFNGEIYNYIEIREELKNYYHFKTRTDTEAILAAYSKWGEKCVHKFNGMWAFAILDTLSKTIFFSRDRFGIKPFYYYSDEKSFYFASDVPPLYALLKNKLSPDYQIIYDFLLTNRTNHNEKTFFRGIKRLKQGRNLILGRNKFIIKRYYYLKNTSETGFTEPHEFRELFRDSIKIQLRSDVPVGIMLSGGIDSSSIAAVILNDLDIKDINSFSAVYNRGQIGDESQYIDEFKTKITNIYYTHPTVDTFLEELDDFIKIQVEPVGSTSYYAEYKVMKLAKNYCTVILNGQGSDEIMGGYHYFFGAYFCELFKSLRLIKLFKEIYKYYSVHRSFFPLKYFFFYSFPDSYKYELLVKYHKNFQRSFLEKYKPSDEDSVVNTLFKFRNLKEFFLNHFEYKFEHLLLQADKNGMGFSIETRFPFLDYRLIEKLYKTDNSLILHEGKTKIILRKAMQDILPRGIVNRMDKVGFQTPEGDWFRSDKLKKFLFEVFSSKSLEHREIFNKNKLLNMLNNHIKGNGDYGKELWKILNLELWFRKYFD